MRNKSKSIAYQLVTPEEPVRCKRHRDKNKNESDCDSIMKADTSIGLETDNSFFMPSLKNTKELESEILDMISNLQQKPPIDNKEEEDEIKKILNLLNRSITAISHWSLQAQLVQLRSDMDDRQAVENNLLRKEMELLVNRRSQVSNKSKRIAKQSSHTLFKENYLRSPPYLQGIPGSSSPKKDTLRIQPNINKTEDPASLKLVESNKPHPRMKRNSDNPSTNEYVRVFHLQRG